MTDGDDGLTLDPSKRADATPTPGSPSVAPAEATSEPVGSNLEADLDRTRRLETLGHLAGGVAHDFNNLLAVILNCASFVHEAVAQAALVDEASWGPVRSDVEQIEQAAERGARLTKQLLTFAQRETVQPDVIGLNDIVRDMEALLRRMIDSDIEIHMALEPDLWTVRIDPGNLEQVVMNLALNARGAMPRGGLLRIGTSNVHAGAGEHPGAGRAVRLCVADSGTGMDDETLGRAFEPFFTTKSAGEGTGLGLATVHGIVDRAGGRVQIESELGVGTTVTVMLPVTERVEPLPEPLATVAAPPGGETILVVDDEETTLEITSRILRRGGYHVVTATSGAEAVAVLEERTDQIDLLLADVIAPKMPGIDLAARLLAERPHLRVVYMSGHGQSELATRGTLDRSADFVQKPFSRATLLACVRASLDRRPPLP